jgi:hypothetical protein
MELDTVKKEREAERAAARKAQKELDVERTAANELLNKERAGREKAEGAAAEHDEWEHKRDQRNKAKYDKRDAALAAYEAAENPPEGAKAHLQVMNVSDYEADSDYEMGAESD